MEIASIIKEIFPSHKMKTIQVFVAAMKIAKITEYQHFMMMLVTILKKRSDRMKKSEPKMILNISLSSEEIEEKVKIAMDEYVQKVIYKNLDEEIAKVIDKRIERLVSAPNWSNDRLINNMPFSDFVKSKTEKAIGDFVEKNIKEILAKRFAEIMTDRSFANETN